MFHVFLCFDKVTSWQHCIDYNTTNARLSKLGATPAAQASGKQIPSSAKGNKHCQSKVTSAPPFPSFGDPQTASHPASPGTSDPSDDSSELCSQAPRLEKNFPLACPNCLVPQHPRKGSRHCARLPRQKRKEVVLNLRRHYIQHALLTKVPCLLLLFKDQSAFDLLVFSRFLAFSPLGAAPCNGNTWSPILIP